MTPGSEARHALIVATARYDDPKLQQLRAPAADAERLAAVLRDPEKGDFEVDVVLDASHAQLTRRIAAFFRDRRPQDLLLLHFSCHGVKDDRGELFLAAADTEIDLLSATGVSAAWLNDQISRTRSRRTVVLLDCCFSGSFPFGMRARGSGVDAPEQLQGRGRVIITASNAMEYAYEGDELQGEGQPSVFTEAVVEGLSTGEADLDNDRLVSVDDLYHYVYDRVKEATPSQTPSKKSDLEGPLFLAKSSYRRQVTPARLDPELLARTEDRYAGIRGGAVQELAGLLESRDPAVVLAARHALTRMLDDDSRRVSASARAALTAVEETDGDRGDSAPAPGDFSLHVDHEPPHARPGDEVTWRLAVDNTGGSRLTDVTVRRPDGALLGECAALPPGHRHVVRWRQRLPEQPTPLVSVTAIDERGARTSEQLTLGVPGREPPAAPAPTAPGTPAAPRADAPEEPVRRRSPRWWVPVAAATVIAAGVALAVIAGDGSAPDGRRAGSSTPAIPQGNLTANPSFERDTAGWDSYRSRLDSVRAPDAPDGERVARVRLDAGPGEYSIDDLRPTVRSSVEGRTYTAGALVKATPDNDGRQFCIGVREDRDDSSEGDVGETYAAVTGSAGAYRRLSVSYVAKGDGNRIDVHVFRNPDEPVREAEAFLVDAIALVEGGTVPSPADCAGYRSR